MKISWMAVLALILFSVPSAAAISPPDVTFIPEKISANSSFILIADPHAATGESVSVKWVVYGIENGYGSIPFTGTRHVCYFSNTDTQNTCGPNIFSASSHGVPYEMQINATNQYLQTESTFLNVDVGGIAINSQISVSGTNVYIKAWPQGEISGTVSYKAYESAGLSVVQSGSLVKNDQIAGYTTNITLSSGEYYIAFSAASSTDFGGGVSRVVVGGSGGLTEIQADSIVYKPFINAGQEFNIETFKITNLGTDNLTSLSISVPSEISNYLSITLKKTTMEPNESVYMTVTIHNIQESINFTTSVSLLSGTTIIKEIPVDLKITVMTSGGGCEGKDDKDDCMGGICCGGVCRTGGAECCSAADCDSYAGETCSTEYKCVPSVTPGECDGQIDKTECTNGICCSGACITGGECCSTSDCGYGEECSISYICTASTGECEGQADGMGCSSGFCCSGYCQQCCTDGNCNTAAGETCSTDGYCTSGTTPGGGIDVITIALIIGGVVAAAVVGFFVFQKFVKKKGGKEGDAEFDEGGGKEEEEDEFSDEDFY